MRKKKEPCPPCPLPWVVHRRVSIEDRIIRSLGLKGVEELIVRIVLVVGLWQAGSRYYY
jgi:hypothetical protein